MVIDTKGKKLFVWTTAGGSAPIVASSEEKAKEVAIANRVKGCGQTPEEALSWFERDDNLFEVDCLPLYEEEK